ncbi:MAG: hypothetical protein Q9M28_09320 [Mariprofundaceae bacterium]|nr:hypothetical protein [Mariprofundaceae bacterium]
MHYVISLEHQVKNPELAAQFFIDTLGFYQTGKDGYPFFLENGSLSVNLVQGESHDLTLTLQCSDVEKDCLVLLKDPDVHLLQEITQTDHRIHCALQCNHGIRLILNKILNEDDLDILLPLPSSLAWDEKTDLNIRRILRMVPLGFRKSARQRITDKAEYDSVEQGSLMVNESLAMQTMVAITPAFQIRALMEVMNDEGIDSSLYIDASSIED